MQRPLAARIVDRAAELGVSALSITGGEPFLCISDVQFLIRRATAAGIRHTRTGTNGFAFTGSESRTFTARMQRLADGLFSSGLRNLWISLDSGDVETHERLRGLPGVVAGIAEALPLFHAAGLYPAANLGLTRRLSGEALPRLEDVGADEFRGAVGRGLTAFFARAADLGFTMANVCYPMSVSEEDGLVAAYLATADEQLVRFSLRERSLLYATLAEVIAEQRHSIRVFTPLSSLDALTAQLRGGGGHPCRGGVDYFFVDPHGDTFPCGYRGDEQLGPFVTFRPRRTGRPTCTRCDWECFRDPSELFGPVTSPGRRSLPALRLLSGSDARMRLWWQDIRYARACDLFDGRRPPDPARLSRFAPASDGARRPLGSLPGRRASV
jgi:MoaA/NifB/PqqE/SkfB family radical SAM enzyme